MEMTFNEYITKLDCIAETVMYNYEMSVMNESAGEKIKEFAGKIGSGIKSGAETAGKAIWKIIKRIIDAIIGAIRKLIEKLDTFIAKIKIKEVTVSEDFEVFGELIAPSSKFTTWYNALNHVIKTGKETEAFKVYHEIEKMRDQIQEGTCGNNSFTYKAGSKIDKTVFIKIRRTLASYIALNEKVKAVTDTFDYGSDETPKKLKEVERSFVALSDIIHAVVTNGNKFIGLFASAVSDEVTAKEADRVANKAKKEFEKERAKAAKAVNKTKKTKKDDKADGEVNNESAVVADLLRTAAFLLNETAEEADDDYPTDVVVGKDEEPDLEEIEDLVDGDKEAMAILTDDEGGKAITESVVINFD